MRRAHRILVACAALAVVVTVVLVVQRSSVRPDPRAGHRGPPTLEPFVVGGADIIDQAGEKFVPIGGNVGARMVSWASSTYAFTSTGLTATDHARDAIDWGWNIVRVNVVCDPPPEVSLEQTIAGVQALIDEYTAEGIVVMPDCHDVVGADATLEDDRYRMIHRFWDAIIDANATNPFVWINYVNEPFTEGAAPGEWSELATTLYERVRAKGAKNLFVVDMPDWGQGADDIARSNDGEQLLAGRTGVVLSWHNYGRAADTADAMSAVAEQLVAKQLPVIIGEAGWEWDGTSDTGSAERDRLGATWSIANARTYGFGVIVWHATGPGDRYSLRLGDVGAWYDESQPLSELGELMRTLRTTG